MNNKYVVKLTDEERQRLQSWVCKGNVAARKIQRAWILLKADAGAEEARSGPMRRSKRRSRSDPLGPSTACDKPLWKKAWTRC